MITPQRIRKHLQSRSPHWVRLLIGLLITAVVIMTMVSSGGYALNKIQNFGLISCYVFSPEEADGLVIDTCTMLQFLFVDYVIVLFLYFPLSYILGVPVYFMLTFFIFASPLHLLGAALLR